MSRCKHTWADEQLAYVPPGSPESPKDGYTIVTQCCIRCGDLQNIELIGRWTGMPKWVK